ncbi:ROK family transcriptional regulator [Brachybacterium aquaticum]|uniref:Putative NBD/HSP70 family sugar kinase n=1 Tax=Brachybacterium aquaticum TaxID=1432564 RepID=A0A841AGR3_9MICO|nr:ROK family transcriptional regulator [Brachybacterium aquaticum]MBB5832274.1 putative NBD/HSP70 family sugar kinase [Brachybacterium aquaticum]
MRPTTPLDRVAGAHDAAVLAVARRGDPVSRAALAQELQVTPQAISKILGRLMERGLVEEAGTVGAGPGKPTTLYRIVPGSRRAIGLHLTRSRLHSVVVDLTGEILERREIETGGLQPVPDLIATLAAQTRSLVDVGPGTLLGVGVGMPGPVDGEEGVYRGTSDPDPWRGAPIRRLLAAELDLPVLLDHDSRAALVGEAWSQPGLLRNAALVLVEDGLGAALCIEDRIVRGAHSHAGEVGHTVVRLGGEQCPCGRRGCAQVEYRAALERGDEELGAQILAEVVVNLVRLVDVDRVVLGGRTVYEQHARSMDAIRDALTEGLRDEPWVHVEVMLSTRGTDLIAVGAACEVLEHKNGLPQLLFGADDRG